jgi:hypothetical protein
MNKCGIYRIINITTGNFYIGSTNNYRKRKDNHLYLLRRNKHHSPYLQNSFNKHKEECFLLELIEECNEDLLLIREQYYIDTLNPKYNVAKIAGRTVGVPCSENKKKKIGLANKGKIKTPEMISKLKKSWNGKYNGAKKIYMYDSNFNFIKSWNSGADASREYGICLTSMSRLASKAKLIISPKSKLKGFILTFNPLINNTNE